MLTEDGPKVLEFNCRFGDPETQALVPLLEADLLAVLAAAARGDLGGAGAPASSAAGVSVVVAAGGYPAEGDRGSDIGGVAEAESAGALVFHAGTARQGDRLVTNGGRILAVTGVGETVSAAREIAYQGVARISFPGMRYRGDIAVAASTGPPLVVNPASEP
jgi:phosphoribosylamine---glycine ligase